MAVVGDVVELVHEQQYLGQAVNNVYYFECNVAAALSTLTTWFETNVVPDIRANQNDLVTHVNLRARNLFAANENYEEPLTGTGTVASASGELPAYMAYAIRLDHDNGEIRPGFKRFVGVEEASLSDSLLGATRMTAMLAIGDNLVNPPADANANWLHVIVGRICEEPNPVSGAIPACLKYRLPENQGEANVGIVVTYEVYSQPTTQNSRKWYT